ncbi:hypothetical protein CC78DRAFT_118721 [Lojkania enalia]|uniref:Uncharacterized protein n=1 Tax=Lojkania enalia TaxID=147567 RepID=A0A9P4KDH9_9PLEO|nr:hypothetical protein CC78DRAFT_118721 [Didymosphaeria enalia]
MRCSRTATAFHSIKVRLQSRADPPRHAGWGCPDVRLGAAEAKPVLAAARVLQYVIPAAVEGIRSGIIATAGKGWTRCTRRNTAMHPRYAMVQVSSSNRSQTRASFGGCAYRHREDVASSVQQRDRRLTAAPDGISSTISKHQTLQETVSNTSSGLARQNEATIHTVCGGMRCSSREG